MSKISAIDFANNVRQNKQRLINHCLENGKAASAANTLDEIVSINNEINGAHTGFEVKFVDIDGTVLKTEYVEAGGSATPPSNPSYDSDLLEFDSWKTNKDITNVQDDIVVGAFYKTKFDSVTNQRPTYLKAYFDDYTGLTTTLYFGRTHTNTFVDWGDGSAVNEVPSGNTASVSHTYAQTGHYTIKVYGDSYGMMASASNLPLLETNNNQGWNLIAIYLGENFNNTNSNYNSRFIGTQNNLEILVIVNSSNFVGPASYGLMNGTKVHMLLIPENCGNMPLYNSSFLGSNYYMKYLLVLTNKISSTANYSIYIQQLYTLEYFDINTSGQYSCTLLYCTALYNLKKFPFNIITSGGTFCCQYCNIASFVIPENISVLQTSEFSNCYNLKSVTITSPTTGINNSNVFSNCWLLEEIILPQNYNANLVLTAELCNFKRSAFVNMCKNLKDLTGDTAKTITLLKRQWAYFMNNTYVDANGNEVAAGTTGAKTLLQYVTDKNWTVTFS